MGILPRAGIQETPRSRLVLSAVPGGILSPYQAPTRCKGPLKQNVTMIVYASSKRTRVPNHKTRNQIFAAHYLLVSRDPETNSKIPVLAINAFEID